MTSLLQSGRGLIVWYRDGSGLVSFAILRAALLCVRGSRTKWRSLGIIDGASLPIVTAD